MSEEQSGNGSGHSPEGAERVMPYASGQGSEAKGKQVETMFDSIAPAYDLMNNVMTLGMHTLWRQRALKLAIAEARASLGREPEDVLDEATGTGDVIFALRKHCRRRACMASTSRRVCSTSPAANCAKWRMKPARRIWNS